MSIRSPTSLEVKIYTVQRCFSHKSNPNNEEKQLGVSSYIVNLWIRKYTADGLEGLKESSTCKTYSNELKLAATKDVLSG